MDAHRALTEVSRCLTQLSRSRRFALVLAVLLCLASSRAQPGSIDSSSSSPNTGHGAEHQHGSVRLHVFNHTDHYLRIDVDGRDVGYVRAHSNYYFLVRPGRHVITAHTRDEHERWGPKDIDIHERYVWDITE